MLGILRGPHVLFKMALAVMSILAALAIAPKGQAHYTTWYWSETLADSKVRHSRWAVQSDVFLADCQGTGNSIFSNGRRRIPLYKHFDCVVTYFDTRRLLIKVHVTSRDSFTFTR